MHENYDEVGQQCNVNQVLEERHNEVILISYLIIISRGSKCSWNIQQRKHVERKERKKEKIKRKKKA